MTGSESAKPEKTTERAQAADRSRQQFLDIGVRLLSERLASPLDSLRAKEVVAETDLTAGAFYHHWPSQEAFRRDLRQHAIANLDLRQTLDRFVNSLSDLSDGLSDAVRENYVDEVRSVTREANWWLEVAMLAGGHPDDLTQLHQNLTNWIAQLCGYYGAAIEILQLRLRPGFTVDWIARTMMALVDGLSLQLRVGIGIQMEPTSSDDWTVVDYAVAAVLLAALEEPSETSGNDVKQRFRALFDGT